MNSGLEWLQMLAVVRVEAAETEEFRAVFEEAVRRLQTLRGRDTVRWYDLMRIVLTWAAWRRPRAEQPSLWAAAEANQAHPGEVQTMVQSAVESWIEEGMVKGRAEGQLSTARALLRVLLEDRFGTLAETAIEQIASCTDMERLQSAVRQVSKLSRLDEFRL